MTAISTPTPRIASRTTTLDVSGIASKMDETHSTQAAIDSSLTSGSAVTTMAPPWILPRTGVSCRTWCGISR